MKTRQPELKIIGSHVTGALIVDDSANAELQAKHYVAEITKAAQVEEQTSAKLDLPDPTWR